MEPIENSVKFLLLTSSFSETDDCLLLQEVQFKTDA